ncbi:group III truncated hemoglobin [Helicobacter apodemus]|uniref:Group III truncated hemoglobin n=1 Tax=Helicobacter apodemus TaxID=135569 RepID=A0A2U8FEF8_9HELI|nr:group III truncated hemoglobin [Helicobacter apodemus]AWI34408.1 hypothetical protein CDV25_06270 [Helicobacter apodemus]
MKYQEICVEGIMKLMDIFYDKIRKDKSGLGEIFNNKIGEGEEEWREHKAKIANFWQGMLLGSGNYSGQPMKAHLELPPFPREFFSTWLGLFEESLGQVFEDNVANNILHRARMIADRFQYMLYENGH